MTGQRGVPNRRQAGLAVASLSIEDEKLTNRSQCRCVVRMIGLVTQTVKHHRGICHCRENAAKTVQAIEALGDEDDSLFNRPSPRVCREERLSDTKQPIEHGEGNSQWRRARTG